MKIINLGTSDSILSYFISELRDQTIQQDPMRFRRNLERIGEVFAYEISKTLDYQSQNIQTPLATANVSLFQETIVIASIMRAGLPLHNGLSNYFDRSENAFISSYRKYSENGEFKINFEYISSPEIAHKTLILADPMLASGRSMEIAYQALLEKGVPAHTHIVTVIASKAGVAYLQQHLQDESVTLWTGAIDETLTSKAYISPGLGDAGDLAFGQKSD